MIVEADDIKLFHQQIKGAKRLTQDTYVAPRLKSKRKQQYKELVQQQDNLFYFSDQYEPLLQEDQKVRYLREGEDSHLLKQLRRGDFAPELFLDLHGLTREQAKTELAALLHACEKENIHCASIMTGYGTFALKQQIPRWLVQHPKVRALHQAPKEWGGDAAFLILFETVEK
ncbi:DNA-nicking endonuclease, Smr domain [Pasteurella testudinis DSM 23072]|uniref:Ribosome rescue factor SmrB n=1 Tax=Pasteurella testudinis DSM 23072 TaxID=1122938 RepID=A0A1W1UYS8_9PAST|nr:DNA-nicking endonuclease, Smr domain [Pasteurella testudinis DSM 23072]SUB51765.1 Smr protein/MutS2 C-terminal family protein [Pasteurella testudinis]